MPQIQIRLADSSDHEAWDSYVSQHKEGLAYHLFGWKQALEQGYGWHSHYLLAELNDGRICGVLPAVKFQGLARQPSYISLPYCDVAGPLADTVEIERALIHRLSATAFSENAPCELRCSAPLQGSTGVHSEKVRMLLPLPESSEALLAGFKSKLRSQVKKPVKDGLIACLGGVELVESFYSVFSRNMRDLGSPVHSRAWIDAIVQNYGENVRVGVVKTADGVIAAAGIILIHRRTVSIPWASSLHEFNRLNPNMLLYWTFLSFAADNGYGYFDFGRSTPGEGTYRFKEQWGAQPRALQWVSYLPEEELSPIDQKQGPSSLRHLVASCWKKLPLPLANFFGPILRKRLSL